MKKSIVVIFAVLGIILSSCKNENEEEKLANTKYRLEISYPNADSIKGNFSIFTLPQDSTEDCDYYKIWHFNTNKEFSINPRVNQNGDTLPYILRYIETTTWNVYTAKVFQVDSVAYYPLVFDVDFPTYIFTDQHGKLMFLYLHGAVTCKLFTRDGRYLDSVGPFYDETKGSYFTHVFAVSNAGKFYQTDLIEYEKEQIK